MSDWNEIVDFNDQVNKNIARFELRDVILNPEHLLNEHFAISRLEWSAIRFGKQDIEKVPNDKRGVYGFAIRVNSDILPPHGYILYIGIAGRNSDRPLRERYKEYLRPKQVIRRGGITRVMNWRAVLQFIFAPVDDTVTTDDLQELETQINTALIPPFSEQDMDADIRQQRRAWR